MKRDGALLTVDKVLSRRFATMSFVCALLIVYLHTGGSTTGDKIGFYFDAVLKQVCRAAIPWFFFAAGFFLSRHITERGWWQREVQKRIRTLIVPFWIWGTVIALSWVLMAILIRSFGYPYNGIDAFKWLSPKGVATVLGLNPLGNIPTMWFLRTLFIFVVVSPFVGGRGVSVAVAFVAYATFKFFYFEVGEELCYVLTSLISLRGLAYFALGMWVSCKSLRISRWIGVTLVIISLTSLVFILVSEAGAYARLMDVIMVPGLLVLMWALAGCVSLPGKITSMSFPLYLLHGTIAYYVSALYGVIGYGTGRTCFGFALMRFLVCVGLSLAMAFGLRRFFPRFSAIAFGGR